MLLVVAVVFAGCQQKLKKENVEKGINEMFVSFQKNGIEKTLTQYVDGYDKMSDNDKKKLQDAFAGKEFKILEINNDEVRIEVSATPADGGQINTKTVIFKVIEVDGKIRIKELLNSVAQNDKPSSSGPNGDVLADNENDPDSPLSEEHD